MNRRDFIKTALAGLAALVLPKGKAPVKHKDTRELIEESRSWASSNGYTDTLIWGAVPSRIGGQGPFVELETHSTVGPMFATDEMIVDWEAMG